MEISQAGPTFFFKGLDQDSVSLRGRIRIGGFHTGSGTVQDYTPNLTLSKLEQEMDFPDDGKGHVFNIADSIHIVLCIRMEVWVEPVFGSLFSSELNSN